MNIVNDSHKELSLRLAELLYAGEAGSEACRELLEKLNDGMEAVPAAVSQDATPVADASPERIGIWIPRLSGSERYYERDKNLVPSWRRWANQHTIPPKKEHKRVVLIGESVARGYFYDPFYNPAHELRSILQSVAGLEGTEVIDLAKNGMQLHEVWEISEACTAMEPDAIIIFAGNNWPYSLYNPNVFSDEENSQLEKAYASHNFPAIKELLESKLYDLASSLMAQLGEIAANSKIKVIVVVPEFNLADWKTNSLEKMALFQGDGAAARWIEARDRAEEWLSKGDTGKAWKETEIMIATDASNSYGYELAAKCKMNEGEKAEARKLMEQARDAAIFSKIINYSPRCMGIARKAMLDGALKYSFGAVDLSEIFRQHLSGGVPGKELFMDYCHLSLEGIKLAMQATAGVLLPMLASSPAAATTALSTAVSPDDEVIAMAHAFAAIHSSGYQQPKEIIRYHCLQSISASAKASRFMALFVSMTTRKSSSVLSRNYEEMILKNMADQYLQGLGLLHSPNKKMMNIDLADCMVEVLQHVQLDMRSQLKQLRAKEHGVEEGKINLLASHYHQLSHMDINFSNQSHYKARDTASDFILITAKKHPVRLKLVCRLSYPVEKNVTIKINDAVVETIVAGKYWKTYDIVIPSGLQQEGINTVSVNWPLDHSYLRAREVKPLKENINQVPFINGLNNNMYPLFGEIHMLTAEICN